MLLAPFGDYRCNFGGQGRRFTAFYILAQCTERAQCIMGPIRKSRGALSLLPPSPLDRIQPDRRKADAPCVTVMRNLYRVFSHVRNDIYHRYATRFSRISLEKLLRIDESLLMKYLRISGKHERVTRNIKDSTSVNLFLYLLYKMDKTYYERISKFLASITACPAQIYTSTRFFLPNSISSRYKPINLCTILLLSSRTSRYYHITGSSFVLHITFTNRKL